MFSLNKASILGNVTRDPESRTTSGDSRVVTFSVATSNRWKDKTTQELKEVTEFHNCVAFGSLAGIITDHVHKGTKMYVEGRLQTRSWDTPEGKKAYKTEIVADDVIILGEKAAKAADEATPTMPEPGEVDIDSIPF